MSYPSYAPDPRYPRVRSRSHLIEIVGLIKDFISLGLFVAGLYAAITYLQGGNPFPAARTQTALPMDATTFAAIKANAVPWTFTYSVPGESALVLKHSAGTGPASVVIGSYDNLTDVHDPAVYPIGIEARMPLFRAILEQPLEFFGVEHMPTHPRRYRDLADWPESPLFFFETPGPRPRQHYVLAFGGEPPTRALSPAEQPVQQAAETLSQFILDRGTPSTVTTVTGRHSTPTPPTPPRQQTAEQLNPRF